VRSRAGFAAVLLLAANAARAQNVAAPAEQARYALDPAQFDRYAGYYQPNPRSAVRFYREGSRYYFNTAGTPQKMEIFAEAADRFTPGDRPLHFAFRVGADGVVKDMVVSIPGREMAAPRITEQAANALLAAVPAPTPAERNWTVKITPHRLITNQPGSSIDYWPAFTADGRRIIFNRKTEGSKNWALFQVPVAGGTAQLLFERPGFEVTRANSGAAGRVAFLVNGGVWTMREDGSEARQVPLKDILIAAYPSFYPDGKSLALTDLGRNAIYRIDVASGIATPITNESEVLTGMSSVSPDGKSIAFAGQKNNGQGYNQNDNQIWLVDASGAARTVEAKPASGRTPNWSPDGRRIAFESGRGSPDDHYAVFIMNRDGSGLVQLTDYALNGNHPVWSPDGKHLAFSWGSEPGKPNGIAIMDVPD
jgi:dipeptidyl aminopeptidase/acylaminoacyl peptidase